MADSVLGVFREFFGKKWDGFVTTVRSQNSPEARKKLLADSLKFFFVFMLFALLWNATVGGLLGPMDTNGAWFSRNVTDAGSEVTISFSGGFSFYNLVVPFIIYYVVVIPLVLWISRKREK